MGIVFKLTGILLIQTLMVGQVEGNNGTVEQCLQGPFHKDSPSPEGDGFQECLSWKEESCCTVEVSQELLHNKSKGLYNFHWDRCGDLSPECEQYIKDEECFYQCEPYLAWFKDPDYLDKGYIRDVPICKSYCDDWFEACKYDKTCVTNWLADFDYSLDENHCPAASTCRTFEEVYTNAEGLCNRMWGSAFVYHSSDTNCMVMSFESTCGNPNRCVNGGCSEDVYACHASPVSSLHLAALAAATLIYCMFNHIQDM